MRRIDLKRIHTAHFGTMRAINRQIVLNFVRDRGPISRAEIARLTKLQRSTVSEIVDSLLGEGLIEEIGAGRSTGGRCPTLLALRTTGAAAVGIDIAPTRTTVATSDLAGGLLESEEFETDHDFGRTIERAAAAAVRLVDPGPVLFRQERVGRDGRLFTIYKFRTMVVDQDAVLDRSVYEARERAGLLTKLPGDPRVTRIGRLLRRSSVDELPQLLNVLKGEMSLVGPRPLVARQLDPFPAIARERAKMRPGMTGAWQVSDRARYESVESMADADLDYVRRYRLWRDLWIVLCTLPACCRSDTV